MKHKVLVGAVFVVASAASAFVLSPPSHGPAPAAAAVLRARFPEGARHVLDAGGGFARVADGFRPNEAGASAVLPRMAGDAIRFTTSAGEVRVRELGAGGDAWLEGDALAYRRAGGASFWTAVGGALEEWLAIDAAHGDAPVAAWEVEGGVVKERGAAIEIASAEGDVLLRVAAPAAWTTGDRPLQARLTARGSRIELWADAGGEPALVDPSWAYTQGMTTTRGSHTLTVLQNGLVLVAGGYSGTSMVLQSAELYDLKTNKWATTATMTNFRAEHAAALMKNGMVMVAGGYTAAAQAIAAAEIYDPNLQTWTQAPSMAAQRTNFTLTTLPNGLVVAVGGQSCPNTPPQCVTTLDTVEYYDPVAKKWSAAKGTMSSTRAWHAVAVDAMGGLIIVGGAYTTMGMPGPTFVPQKTVDRFDPTAHTVSALKTMNYARTSPTATTLPDGTILVVGGASVGQPTAETFDLTSDAWTLLPGWLPAVRSAHIAVLIPDAGVLVAGGEDSTSTALSTAEFYGLTATVHPATTLPMILTRYNSAAGLLSDGRVLVTGGQGSGTSFRESVEAYSIFGDTCTPPSSACTYGSCWKGMFCCNSACTGACQTCLKAAGAPADGICGPVSDKTACTGGTCMGGVCITPSSSSSGHSSGSSNASSSGSSTGGAGGGQTSGPPIDFGCALARARARTTPDGRVVAAALVMVVARRARRRRRRSS
jgi:hypothetical protein